jgi:hypothetical protein
MMDKPFQQAILEMASEAERTGRSPDLSSMTEVLEHMSSADESELFDTWCRQLRTASALEARHG